MEKTEQMEKLPKNGVFALDIGTRSVIGVVGLVEDEKVNVIAIERAEHTQRAMIDGQIEDIQQVAKLTKQVKEQLEQKIHYKLENVCVAAAGRALKTQKATYEMELPEVQLITDEMIQSLEAGAIGKAEEAFNTEDMDEAKRQFFLVGHTVTQYYLDEYMISNLREHHGRKLKADVIATFLPSEVVESLCTTMNKIGLEVASLTLEPIAALNAAIPKNLRLLNLALVDIGAGTSDIAVCRDGSVTGYTMATLAGDEITETIMREYLVDFETAEAIKMDLNEKEQVKFVDVLGFEQEVTAEEAMQCVESAMTRLCQEITEKILEINGGTPSAVFLAGGGSKLKNLRNEIIKSLDMSEKRVGIAGNNYQFSAFSATYDLNNPEYATPLGIAISSGLNLINDSFRVMLNEKPARLFRNGTLSIMDILMMNGYTYQDMIGRSGQNTAIFINGKRKLFYGELGDPAVLKLNGEDAQITTIVHAGDSITFVPARHGKASEVYLSNIVDETIEGFVTVNGEEVPWDTLLKNGDSVEIHEQEEKEMWDSIEDTLTDLMEELEATKQQPNIEEVEQLAKEAQESEEDEEIVTEEETKEESEETVVEEITKEESEETVVEEGTKEQEDEEIVVEEGTKEQEDEKIVVEEVEVEQEKEKMLMEKEKMDREIQEQAEREIQEQKELLEAEEREARTKQQEESKIPPITGIAQNMISFTLNEKTIVLPRKADGLPYYLMDMLQYSGLDFDHLTGPVQLTVNGVDAQFQQVLRQGDQIVICQ